MLNTLLFYILIFHILWASFAILIHRSKMHRHYDLHPVLEHILRFLIWITYGFYYKNWCSEMVAQHRKHHKISDSWTNYREYDPVSPHIFTLRQLMDFSKIGPGTQLYTSPIDILKYAKDTKDYNDWIENNLYLKYPKVGLVIIWIISTLLFGLPGFIIGGIWRFFNIQIITLTASSLHVIGYRTSSPLVTTDKSVNLFPIGILLAGEELHANHHDDGGKLNYANHWWEFDLGYWYAIIFSKLGLLTFTKR